MCFVVFDFNNRFFLKFHADVELGVYRLLFLGDPGFDNTVYRSFFQGDVGLDTEVYRPVCLGDSSFGIEDLRPLLPLFSIS